MREIRLSGSEGGAAQVNAPFLPLSFPTGDRVPFTACPEGNLSGVGSFIETFLRFCCDEAPGITPKKRRG